ncbi:MAG: hypothetical protein JXP37_06330, partial [Coriobacteriia bacterium]|nr:hypothetical protein [Coriobacteriia bacterium]
MSARITARWIADGVVRSDSLDALPAGVSGPVWIDVADPDERALAAVSARVPLPPLAVEDCLHFPQRPKLDIYHDLSFVIWLLPQMITGDGVVTHEIDMFLTEEHLVTVHSSDVPALSRVIEHADTMLRRGVEWTAHAILDAAVDEVFPLVESLSDELEEIEDLVLADARPE